MKVLKWTTADRNSGQRNLKDGESVDICGVSSLIVNSTSSTVLFVRDVIECSVEEKEA